MRSKIAYSYLIDLAEIFQILKKFNMYLNLTKCAFRVNSRKFLGFIVYQRGIDTNSKKVRAILEMHPPRLVREVQ